MPPKSVHLRVVQVPHPLDQDHAKGLLPKSNLWFKLAQTRFSAVTCRTPPE